MTINIFYNLLTGYKVFEVVPLEFIDLASILTIYTLVNKSSNGAKIGYFIVGGVILTILSSNNSVTSNLLIGEKILFFSQTSFTIAGMYLFLQTEKIVIKMIDFKASLYVVLAIFSNALLFNTIFETNLLYINTKPSYPSYVDFFDNGFIYIFEYIIFVILIMFIQYLLYCLVTRSSLYE